MLALALVFLLESWLWEKISRGLAWAMHTAPVARLVVELNVKLEELTPLQTLGVLFVPIALFIPLQFVALWLMAEGHVLSGITTIAFAKVAGIGITSFLFTVLKPKLLQVRQVNWLYEHCLIWREKAHAMVKPYTRFLKTYLAMIKPQASRRNMLAKLRVQMHKLRQ